ncbi:hypothetical protein DH86_00002622 [Scytalidium sp. 3C]|nr:hypothetical protein DH86_00002622 [Scytalidium sp. 3C]
MPAEDIQFTLEQILNVHRPWITQLYVQECKTEQDIVSLLQERGFHITTAQIHRCLIQWALILPSATAIQSYRCCITGDGYHIRNPHKKRPNPDLSYSQSSAFKEHKRPSDLLEAMCNHRQECEALSDFRGVAQGSTQLEIYWSEYQRYQRIATGLSLDKREVLAHRLRRAAFASNRHGKRKGDGESRERASNKPQ